MNRRKRRILIIISAIAGLILIIVVGIVILRSSGTSLIPDLTDSSSLSVEVREQISSALKKAKLNPSAENIGALGMVYHSSANYEEAADCYSMSIEKDEEGWIWNYYLGYLNLEMGNSDAVTEQFMQVIQKDPGNKLAWYYCGSGFRNLREFGEAENYFRQIAQTIPETTGRGRWIRSKQYTLETHATFQLARIYFDAGKYPEAQEILESLIESEPGFGPAYRLLSNLYSLEGNAEKSNILGHRANDLNTYSPPIDTLVNRLALISRSELYLLKKIDEAVNSMQIGLTMQLINQGMQYMPDNRFLISKAIRRFILLGSYDQAALFTEKHLELYADDFEELQAIGTSFFQNDIYPHAIQYLTNALALEPENKDIQKNLATCFWKMDVKPQSYTLLSEIIENHPDDLETLAEVADLMLLELGETERSLEYLVILEHFIPSNARVQKMSAYMAERMGKTAEAIALYESSMKGNPEDRVTFRRLGDLYVSVQNWERAIEHYNTALEHHPNELYFLERLGTLLVTCPNTTLRDMENGKHYSERAFLHLSRIPTVTITAGRSLALSLDALGNKSGAQQVMRTTLAMAHQEELAPEMLVRLEELSRELQSELAP